MRLICFDPIYSVGLLADLIIIIAACSYPSQCFFPRSYTLFWLLWTIVRINAEFWVGKMKLCEYECVRLCLDLTIKSHELLKSLSISANLFFVMQMLVTKPNSDFCNSMRYYTQKWGVRLFWVHMQYTIWMSLLPRYSPSIQRAIASASAMHILS